MTTILKRLADIYTGFTLRESVSYLANGDIKLLQSKDLPKDSFTINATPLTRIDWKYDSQPQYLKHGSVVLLARGEPKAYVYHGTEEDQVIVGHIFIVINLTTDDIDPEYLTWYINKSSIAKRHFETNSTGSTLNMTSISTVRDLPIVIPTIQEQQQILQRQEQSKVEAEVFKSLLKLRQDYNDAFDEQILADVQSRPANQI